MEEGVLAGALPLIQRPYDGSYHTVTSEMAFKIAAAMASVGAMRKRSCIFRTDRGRRDNRSENFMGDIMGDMNSRRGRIQGMIPGEGQQTIKVQAPLAEMFTYAIDLRSMTQGRGVFKMKFSHYEEVPFQESEKIIAAAKAAKEEKDK